MFSRKADNGIRMHENIAIVHMVANASKIGKNQFNSVARKLLFVCECVHGNDANERKKNWSIAFAFNRLSAFFAVVENTIWCLGCINMSKEKPRHI